MFAVTLPEHVNVKKMNTKMLHNYIFLAVMKMMMMDIEW